MGQPYADFFGSGEEVIRQYVDILSSRGIEWGLLGPREGGRLWQRHVLNSIAGAALLPESAEVVDVGSGAGLPGIPLAVLRPDLRLTLLEPLLRRFTFLDQVVTELGLAGRVRVVRARADEHHDHYEVVTARAVAPLPKLVGWCEPLMAAGGRILALKGLSASAELADARTVVRQHGLSASTHEFPVPGTIETTWIIELRRMEPGRG